MNDLKIVTNDVLGKIFWSLPRSPIVLLTLSCTFFRYKLKSKTFKNFMAPFYGWGSTVSRLQPLRGGSLVSNTIPRCL